MKSIITGLLLLLSATPTMAGWFGGDTEPNFIRESSFGKSLETVTSRLGPFNEYPCSPEVKKEHANAKSFRCLRGRSSVMGGGEERNVLVVDNKVVTQKLNFWDTRGRPTNLPKVSEYLKTGEAPPKWIAKVQQKMAGLNMYVATWRFGKSVAQLTAVCPKAKAGDSVFDSHFMDCYLAQWLAVSPIEEEKIPKDIQKNELTFE